MNDKLQKPGAKALNPIEAKLTGSNFRVELRKVLGKIPPEHFVRVALTAMQKQPKIMQCSITSVFQALLDCASVGLEPDGRRAHLIPYGNECKLIIDYKGYVDLMTRPGKGNNVGFIDAAIVYDSDDFEWNMNAVVRHRYDLKSDKHGKKEEAIAAYVAIHFQNGMTKYELMTKAEILSIQSRSKAGNSGPWVTDELEMWKKCPLRRASKWVPINDQTAKALEIDYDRFDPIGMNDDPKNDPPDVPLKDDGGTTFDAQEGTGKKMPKPEPGQTEPPDEGFEEEQPSAGEQNQDGEEQPQAATDPKRELMKLLHSTCRGDAGKIAVHLKRLTKYESKKTGRKSDGKSEIEQVTVTEAEIALAKLREELGFGK